MWTGLLVVVVLQQSLECVAHRCSKYPDRLVLWAGGATMSPLFINVYNVFPYYDKSKYLL